MIIDQLGDEYLTPNIVWINQYVHLSTKIPNMLLRCFLLLLQLASIPV
jgi:hypothetical protein